MPTPSLVSDCPSDASPSRMARTPSLFYDWMARAKIVKTSMPPPVDVMNHFDELYQLKEVPKALAQVPLPTPCLDDQSEFLATVRTWASTLSSVEGDAYGILTALPHLAFAYAHVLKTSNNHSKEHTQRRSIDHIIDLAFSTMTDRHCDFKTEHSYRLVASPGNPDALSDALVTIPSRIVSEKINIARISFQGDRTVLRHLYWSTCGEINGFSIIGFAGEFKKDDNKCNENQLIMVLATAQAQRKALSLEPSIIMGATACRGRVQIFSSYWANDNSIVYVYEHEQQFDLSDPIQMIRLYVFCSKLEKHLQSTLALELNTWSPPTDMATLQNRKWRSPDHTRKRREGGNNGPVEADGLDDDWCMNIMKWRDEVVKDGKEGMVVSDEDNILDAASGWLQFEGRAIAPLS